MSAGVMALEMTISAGLAIGIVDRARLADDMRELTIDDGFPQLALHELKLMRRRAPRVRPLKCWFS